MDHNNGNTRNTMSAIRRLCWNVWHLLRIFNLCEGLLWSRSLNKKRDMARRNNGCVIFRLRIHTHIAHMCKPLSSSPYKKRWLVSLLITSAKMSKMSCTAVSSQRDRWYLNSTHKMNVYVLVIRSRGSCNSWRWNGLRATQLKIKITRRRLGVFWGWSFSFSVDGSIESSTMSCQVVSDETCGTFKLPWIKSSLDDYYCDWNEIPWEIC